MTKSLLIIFQNCPKQKVLPDDWKYKAIQSQYTKNNNDKQLVNINRYHFQSFTLNSSENYFMTASSYL